MTMIPKGTYPSSPSDNQRAFKGAVANRAPRLDGLNNAITFHNRGIWFVASAISIVFVCSYLAARLGGLLMLRPQMIWPVWPGCAFLVAVLLVTPRKAWPALLVAGLAGFAVYDVQGGLPIRAISGRFYRDTRSRSGRHLCIWRCATSE